MGECNLRHFGQVLIEDVRQLLRLQLVGFIWQPLGDITDTNSLTGKPSFIKTSVIQKIRDCSLAPSPVAVEVTTKFGTQQVQATRCQL